METTETKNPRLEFSDYEVTLISGENVIIASSPLLDENAKNFFRDKKEDYGNENIDFTDIHEFIGFHLHAIQQLDIDLSINGVEISGAYLMEDTGGEAATDSTKLSTKTGRRIVQLRDLLILKSKPMTIKVALQKIADSRTFTGEAVSIALKENKIEEIVANLVSQIEIDSAGIMIQVYGKEVIDTLVNFKNSKK